MVKQSPRAENIETTRSRRPAALTVPRSEYVLSLEKGLAVIRAFDEQQPRMTVAETAQKAGLTRAAARRFLVTLQALGYVRSEGRYFQLTPQLLDLGYAYLASQPWWRYAQHVVERLATEIQSACAVTVLDQASIVYVAYASAARFSMFSRSIGARLPAHATAGGRVLLAAMAPTDADAWLETHELTRLTPYTVTDRAALKRILAKVAAEGYATINQEVVLGLHTIGIPIFDRGRRVAAALSVSVQELGVAKTDMVSRFLKSMQRASGEITSGLPT